MKLNTFYHNMLRAKGTLLMALILILTVMAVLGYSYTFEMDYSGPGSEYERSMEQYRDKENQDAAERCGQGEDRNGDREKADQYGRDHGA